MVSAEARVAAVLNRWPVAGLAVGVVRGRSLAWFHGHGVADIEPGTPVGQDTVFRIDSIAKTITAIAVMQLLEQGLVDLDAPAGDYLRAYRLIPAKAGFRPATLRHLLTHTAGVRAVRNPLDLLRTALGWGTQAGHPVPPLAEYYRAGRSRGLKAVTDREIVPAGGGSVYSTTSDMARYAAALLGGGANEHGSVLRPGTIATMFEPHYQPDPRIPGMGLGFFRDQADGHRTVGHDGIWHGFHSAMGARPDEGIGVVTFTNTGPFSPIAATAPVISAVLRSLLSLPDDAVRTDVPEQPWAWRELCGWYSLGPGVLTDPQPRMLGPGAEVAVRRSRT